MANGIHASGSRAGYECYHADGTAPATAAAISFTDEGGNSISTIRVGHASQITVKALNSDTADDLELSVRIKCHPSDDAFTEVATITVAESTTSVETPYTLGDKALGGVEMQIWWNNETGAGTAGTEVSVTVK